MTRRLAIIDLDGTLLGPDKRVSPENLRALERLRDAGFETAFASGRHHRSILRYEPELGAMSWVISASGAVVRNAATNELMHELTLVEADALELCAAARRAHLAIILYHRDGVFMDGESEATRIYAARAGWNPQPGDIAQLAATGIQKIMLSESPAIIQKAGLEIERAFATRFYSVWTEENLVEFLSPQANKAVGTQALAKLLGFEQADIVAFGDGNNDAEVLAWAGYSVAMAHGQKGALTAARAITPAGPPETAFARAVEMVLDRGPTG
jgi:Cof subfamily protein (haloacid dehalogenase superfamily)